MGMDRKDKIEIFFGGVMGIIAIAAAVIEHCTGSNIAGCIKDVSGTLVVVAILFASIKLPSFGLKGKIEESVEKWGLENAPLIFKAKNFVEAKNNTASQGFKILQNQEDFTKYIVIPMKKDDEEWDKLADYGNHKTGKFITMPSYDEMIQNDFVITVYTNQKHFEELPDFKANFSNLITACNNRYGRIATQHGNQFVFDLSFKKIKNSEDIDKLIEVLDFVLSVVKVIM